MTQLICQLNLLLLNSLSLLALEDFSKDPDFPVYCQDTATMPDTLAQLAHIQFQKKLYLQE